jgi:hypothetical protein
MLLHSCGILLGLGCVVLDKWDAQWGGMTTVLGLVVGAPCLLMLTLALLARGRIERANREKSRCS